MIVSKIQNTVLDQQYIQNLRATEEGTSHSSIYAKKHIKREVLGFLKRPVSIVIKKNSLEIKYYFLLERERERIR